MSSYPKLMLRWLIWLGQQMGSLDLMLVFLIVNFTRDCGWVFNKFLTLEDAMFSFAEFLINGTVKILLYIGWIRQIFWYIFM